MKQIAMFALISAGVAVYFNGPVLDTTTWTLVLAGVTGGALMGGRPKQPIGIEDEAEAGA